MRTRSMARLRSVVSSWLFPVLVSTAVAGAPFRYPEGKNGPGEVKYVNDLPVLFLEGTPEQIGTQMGQLAARPAEKLLNYTKDFLPERGRAAAWAKAVVVGQGLLPNFPPEHLREMEAAVQASRLDRNLFVAGNTL